MFNTACSARIKLGKADEEIAAQTISHWPTTGRRNCLLANGKSPDKRKILWKISLTAEHANIAQSYDGGPS